MGKQKVNGVILSSLPLDSKLKRFFLSKFERMVANNGQAYACEKMSQLRTALCGYRADPHRIAHLDYWMLKTGFGRCGWLRKLFMYMDTQPENALQFVKLYCGPNEPIVTVSEAESNQHRVLEEAQRVDPRTPGFMSKWLHHIGRERKLSSKEYQGLKSFWDTGKWAGPRTMKIGLGFYLMPYGVKELQWMKKFICNHSYDEYCDYIRKWKKILWVESLPDEYVQSQMGSVVPRAEMYVDYGDGRRKLSYGCSESFDNDVRDLLAMSEFVSQDGFMPTGRYDAPCGLTTDDYEFILSLCSDEFGLMYLDPNLEWEEDSGEGAHEPGTYVGQIHHIPKKGTVKRRSIAAPNRFIQMGMAPADIQLSIILRRLGRVRDCTYDQSKQDLYIENRVNNENLYAGSVDLHQATDHLPFEWMLSIWDALFEGRVSMMVEQSWDLFKHVSSGTWANGPYRDAWTVGQPLGALPSFRCLGLTHNLLLASLAFTLGYSHDPYVVLGDDLVIMNKALRKAYIKLMRNVGVPLSLHKSFEGNMVEFAGKWFVKNLQPFYNTDQRAISWNSLFDYQFATGVYLPYSKLPRKIRKKFARCVSAAGLSERYSELVYKLIVKAMMPPRGSNVSMDRIQCDDQLIADVIVGLDAEDRPSALDPHSGITLLRGGHPVSFGRKEFANKDGWFQPFRKTNDWYRDKFRPVATDKLVSVASTAVKNSIGGENKA